MMSFNFQQLILFAGATYLLLFFINIYPDTLTHGGDQGDMYESLLLNDFYWNLYYYFWTNSWLVPVFFLSLLWLSGVWVRCISVPPFDAAFLLALIILVLENTDYLYLNPFTSSLFDSSGFNPLLLNSLNKYHPLLLYGVGAALLSTTMSLLVHVLVPLYGCETIYFTTTLATSVFCSESHAPLLNIIMTLSLGAWWALQEGSWGGWWNWDPSEVFGVLIAIVYLRWYHRAIDNPHRFWWLHHLVRSYVGGLFVVYFFIQLNFDLVSHNFGSHVGQFVDPVYFLLAATLSIGYYIANWLSLLVELLPTTFNLLSSSVVGILRELELSSALTTITFIVLGYISFCVLLNDFCWNFFFINTGNTLYSTSVPLLALFFMSTLLIARVSSYSFITLALFILISGGSIYLLVFVFFWSVGIMPVLHVALLNFLFLNLTLSGSSTSSWVLPWFGFESLPVGTSLWSLPDAVSLNTRLCEISSNCFSATSMSESYWNCVFQDSSPENKNFIHPSNALHAVQSLRVGSGLFTFSIGVWDPLTLLLWALLIYFVCLYATHGYQNLSIIF